MELNKEGIRKWLTNKEIRVWRRALFLLYYEGELSNIEIANILCADGRGVRRRLAKLHINYPPLVELKKDHKWYITPKGIESVEHGQKRGKYPIRVR